MKKTKEQLAVFILDELQLAFYHSSIEKVIRFVEIAPLPGS
jgi:hypothetical protein